LHARHGPREFGKIAQKFIALAFCEGGCERVVERGVQGVDVDAGWGREQYTLEIKTTKRNAIPFGRKDAEGLAARQQDGYRPLLGVLKLAVLSQWYIADATALRPGMITIDSLRPYRQRDLEVLLKPLFDRVVACHFDQALTGSQAYLDGVLRRQGAFVVDATRSRCW
jgi:hypothetical protein